MYKVVKYSYLLTQLLNNYYKFALRKKINTMETTTITQVAIKHIALKKLNFSLIPPLYRIDYHTYTDERNTFVMVSTNNYSFSIDITLINTIEVDNVTCKIKLKTNVVYTLWLEIEHIHISSFDKKYY